MTRLKRQFLTYNAKWFNNELPADTIVKWSHSLPVMGQWDDGTIEINAAFKAWPMIWKLTLLHEMAHIATDSETSKHGPRWRRLMRQLARRGAFDRLW